MLRNILIAGTFTLSAISLPAAADHFSPADPEIGDMMEMHEATIDGLIEDGTTMRDDDMGAPDTDALDTDMGGSNAGGSR